MNVGTNRFIVPINYNIKDKHLDKILLKKSFFSDHKKKTKKNVSALIIMDNSKKNC